MVMAGYKYVAEQINFFHNDIAKSKTMQCNLRTNIKSLSHIVKYRVCIVHEHLVIVIIIKIKKNK